MLIFVVCYHSSSRSPLEQKALPFTQKGQHESNHQPTIPSVNLYANRPEQTMASSRPSLINYPIVGLPHGNFD